jgi:hypothetical protein
VSLSFTLTELAASRPTGGEGVKSGPIALAVILVLCIAAYFLFKSMSKHLKKVRDEFPSDESEESASGDGAEQQPGPDDAPATTDEPDQKSRADDDRPSPRAEVPPDSPQ